MKCESCVWIFIVILVLLSLVIAYQFVDPAPPKTIHIATGREGGGYHTFAQEYQRLLSEKQFRLEIQPTAGSIEVLNQLQSGDVSIGLVQGGTGQALFREELKSQGLKTIASLFYEPLWVFHQKTQPIQYLFDLRGKRIAIGEEGSGTRTLAIQLLNDNHVTAENTDFLNLPSSTATQQLIAGEIDAAFFVTSPTASIIPELLNNPNLELLSFKRDMAYSSHYPFLTSIKIGEGMIDLEKNIPESDKVLLAATASLVTQEDLHPDLVRLLLMTLIDVHKPGGFLEKVGQFPSDKFVEFPMNKEASRYLEKGPTWLENIFPFWIASTLDRLKVMLIPLFAVLLPLLKGVLPLYHWGMRFKIFRWYRVLREVDYSIAQMEQLEQVNQAIERMKQLQKELLEVVSVPLGFMGEFYTLQVHIKLILDRLKERQRELSTS